MSAPSLLCESYVCDARPDYPLLITAKRYRVPALASDAPDALTLVLTHGTGYHKEHWEPTIEHLFEHLASSSTNSSRARVPVRIHDVWSIDCQNHGDAAVLNEEEFKWGYNICASARLHHVFELSSDPRHA